MALDDWTLVSHVVDGSSYPFTLYRGSAIEYDASQLGGASLNAGIVQAYSELGTNLGLYVVGGYTTGTPNAYSFIDQAPGGVADPGVYHLIAVFDTYDSGAIYPAYFDDIQACLETLEVALPAWFSFPPPPSVTVDLDKGTITWEALPPTMGMDLIISSSEGYQITSDSGVDPLVTSGSITIPVLNGSLEGPEFMGESATVMSGDDACYVTRLPADIGAWDGVLEVGFFRLYDLDFDLYLSGAWALYLIPKGTRNKALRKVGLSKRGAEVVLEALKPAPVDTTEIDTSAADATYVVTSFAGYYNGEIVAYNEPAGGHHTGVYALGTTPEQAAQEIGMLAYLDGPATGFLSMVDDEPQPAGGVVYVASNTVGSAKSLADQFAAVYLPAPDWSTILRRGDLSPRQVKTLRTKTRQPSFVTGPDHGGWNSTAFTLIGVTTGEQITVSDDPYNEIILRTPGAAPDTGGLTLGVNYCYGGNSFTPAAGLDAWAVWFPVDTVPQPLSPVLPSGITAWEGELDLTMRSLLRGGFTRHQAKLILKELT